MWLWQQAVEKVEGDRPGGTVRQERQEQLWPAPLSFSPGSWPSHSLSVVSFSHVMPTPGLPASAHLVGDLGGDGDLLTVPLVTFDYRWDCPICLQCPR